jgi:hypothetical protein
MKIKEFLKNVNWKEILIFVIVNVILFIFVLYVFKKAIEPYPWVNVAI